jgi:putative hemolysin
VDNLVALFLILLCLFLEGIFSGGELALVVSNINIMRQRAQGGSRRARQALKLMEKPDWFLATTLTGTNLCVVTGTTLATAFFISLFGPAQGAAISVAVMIPTLLILGEIIPKSLFQQHAEFVAPKLAWFIWSASWVLFPVVFLISRISRGTVRISTGGQGLKGSSYITRNGLKFILKSHGDGSDMLIDEKDMVRHIFDFSEVSVDRIMVPLSMMVALPVTATIREAASLVAEKKCLRVPIYQENILNIIGILHYFDLLEALHGISEGSTGDRVTIGTLLRPAALYVPENKPAKDLLIELQKTKERMAVVVDEYGGAVGIVTIDDILEPIVGEIHDEYDSGAILHKRIGAGKYLFNARISLERLKALIPAEIPRGNFDTLGGFLLHRMGRIPRRKEIYRSGDMLFVIEDVDMKSIREVLVIFPAGLDRIQENL